MAKFILAKKIEMSQVFDDKGKVHPVTWLEAGPMFVTQQKTKEKDGYTAVQVGFGSKKEKNVKKPQKICQLADGNYPAIFREFRVQHPASDIQLPIVGDKIEATVFAEGDIVQVSGTTKGKGFQGTVKRHGFHGGPRTHGQKHSERAPGSIGAVWPQRVLKGKRMSGHMGVDRVTVKNLKVIKIVPEKNLIAISGAVPGHRGSVVEVRG
ncbi:50S ribosomal protein L3 [Candidatus Giovannonibacteria bacterium RIFCSPHIGHO2_02_43_13]|uniref:50S ribosomal protein L3 n=1 Tax=Candidatus Giovannonibacteria bacterium RIFCSPHIGHO2_02_43_13 TaxID=1798330 RepID=A0A1F5WUP7_9BACT|nr:MAG: 50S ribosomal protein L3 [Parcubacteria group bacterium GW2011_GWA2_44_13]OGF71792.1 MAG: 50S ribosomal protein L3 [Candidatus Giovannonibacteria bacterium RIFCSPHIGHO2_12_FULL_44_42]OGF79375.1 MAG: 50S ribosomal protein L3 [Candidatus Giovannonibacteria bacterium RIFCSPHIGHO2_02_43_13]OGF89924.1 MAG: 50S ribosomal protein L3 [Candidatus Giovannonibacteria bacterium RIFCSPLOWO2_02_FULL_43_54]OGF97342.1 MAG: 50S ribosomal protein L3 [Candidatus Giovannonibacteria bacterium RIFCSPLOWO2_12